MVKETIRMVADAITNETYGVNVFLSGSGAPPIASVGDETRDDEVAMGNPSKPYPSLSVGLGEPLQLEGEVMTAYRDGIDLSIQIAYMGRDVKIAQGNTDMWDTMRALQKTLRQWLLNENAPDRELDDIQVINATGMEVLPNASGPEDLVIPGGIILRLRVRDIAP
jgi:hypothetical protein